jgi:hypothetical protein
MSESPRFPEWLKTAVVSLISIIATAFITNWMNARAPHLTYFVQDTVPFKDKDFRLITLSVKSDGSKEAESVECTIETNATIRGDRDIKVSPENLNAETTFKNGKVTVKVPLLNVGEAFEVLTVVLKPTETKDATASVRGRGVVGEMKLPPPPPTDQSSLVILGLLVLVFLCVVIRPRQQSA